MSLEPKLLDDRTYEDLLAEAKVRLRRYCPEWTDFNDSDPGMAIVQLCTWLTELMLYRINQVPERNYITFLKRLNIERQPAQPARTRVVIEVDADGLTRIVTVPAGARFVVPAESGDALIYETTQAIDLVPYPLQAIQLFDGLNYTDVPVLDQRPDRERFQPFGNQPQSANALYLGFAAKENEEAIFPDQMVLYFFRPQDDSGGIAETVGRNQSLPVLQWEFQSRFDAEQGNLPRADRWRPLTILQDDTAALTRQGKVVLRGPTADFIATPSPKPVDDTKRYWIRCRLVHGSYAQSAVPEVAFIRSNVVEVENRATFQNEFVGTGDGHETAFRLSNRPIDPESLRLVETDGAGRDTPCQLMVDLSNSKPGDLHYTLNSNSGEIRFGNGRNGRAPGAGMSLVAKSYRAGGGSAGNVPAETIADAPLGVAGIKSVTNPRAATGGRDEESTQDLLDRAGRMLRGNSRAVTRDDYRSLAERIPGVGRAVVLEQRLPQHGKLKIPGAVSVVIIPSTPLVADASVPEKYLPAAELLEAVSRELELVKPAGTEVAVTPPRLRPITVKVLVTAAPKISENQVREDLRSALVNYFRPVPAKRKQVGEVIHSEQKPEPKRWEVGTPLYESSLYEVLLGTRDQTGRRALISEVVEVNLADSAGKSTERVQSIRLDDDQLPLVTIQIEVTRQLPGRLT